MKTLAAILVSIAMPAFAPAQQAPQQRAPKGVKALRDIAYVENGHERQKLDLYLPEKSDAPLPLIIWIHGGGWAAGSKDGCPPLRGGFVERGYAVASIGYRLSGHAIFPAQIEDCKAAIRWLRAHAKENNIDPQKFGVWGSSAGGHLAALVGTSGGVKQFDVGANADQSSSVQAVCDYFGPTDFSAFVAAPGYESHAKMGSPETRLLGGSVADNKDKAVLASPVTHVDSDDPPFLIVHGDRDPTVPIHQSQILFEALKKAGIGVQFHTIRGAGHGGKGFMDKSVNDMVAKFFDERLKNGFKKAEALTTESVADAPQDSDDAGTKSDAASKAALRRGNLWEAILGRDDKDKNGKISREEFTGPKRLFDLVDADHDGFVTREEYEAFKSHRSNVRTATPHAKPSPSSQPAEAEPKVGASEKTGKAGPVQR